MLNTVVLQGRLCSDPELKTTQGGLSYVQFCVATDRMAKKDGTKSADFTDVIAWRKTAEFVCKYFSRGQMIALDGRLQTRLYKDKNGNNRKATEVVANNVHFCGNKGADVASPSGEKVSDTVNDDGFQDVIKCQVQMHKKSYIKMYNYSVT